jgi:sensor domain CHASE-containing protein
MSFTGNENHDITLAAAAIMTKRYRDSISAGDIIGHYFGKDAISDILNQSNCVGIRIYHALNSDNVKQLVIVGVTSDENDQYTEKLAENSFLCPSLCAADNPLNSDV